MDVGRPRITPNPSTPFRPSRGRVRPRSQPDHLTKPPAPAANDLLALVPEDGLVFAIGCDIGCITGAVERQVSVPHALAERIEATFRPAFAAIWKRIPAEEQSLLMAYWREEPCHRVGGRRGGPSCPRPLILIDIESATFAHDNHEGVESFGRVLSFPASLTKGDPQVLQSIIGRALAIAYRFATREHWGLLLSVVDEPLERWQRRQKRPVSDALVDRKAKPLEQAYRAQVAAAIDGVLGRWGLTGC